MEDIKKISIKGMVCDRCKLVLTKAFNNLGLEVTEINLGSVTLSGTSKLNSFEHIQQVLDKNGFELLINRNFTIVQEIKKIVEEALNNYQQYNKRVSFSKLLSNKFYMDYDSVSSLFSAAENITLEKYIINKRLEKVKELLINSRFTLTEIAYITGFSSIQHLSNQFKAVTGFSPSNFRKVKEESSESISGRRDI